jgi:H+-transporting ATPase
LRARDFVPAIVKAVFGIVEADQSPLAGESLTVEKKLGGPLFSGTIIRKEVTGVVTATGRRTYFGQTVELARFAKPKLHMEEVISRFERWLSS